MPLPIAAVMGVWSVVPTWAKVATGGALALFVTYQVGHWKGDNHRDAIWKTKIRAEQVAQEKIVNEAKDLAIREIARLGEEVEKRDAQINEMLIEAEQDANADRPALGTDSLRRINRHRPGGPK